ncbi:MAG: hypothetical protein JWM34_3055 [Ilumatobacteraceae bacterium]|nr:hypothetical protein [Ilumatobacteraceae bacterium]
MEIEIRGHTLSGTMFRVAGVPVHNVHVGLQVRDAPEGLVRGDAASATWRADVRTRIDDAGEVDVAGPAVHGRRGERFLYLTWGDVGVDGGFAMFRRAKLMFGDIDADLVRTAMDGGHRLVATIGLTDDFGGPRSARVHPPAVIWSVEPLAG